MIDLVHGLLKKDEDIAAIDQPPSIETRTVIDMLRKVPGVMAAHPKDFKFATPYFYLKDGTIVKIYENPFNVLHIFLADQTGKRFIYGCYTLLAKAKLESVIKDIQQQYGKAENNGKFRWR